MAKKSKEVSKEEEFLNMINSTIESNCFPYGKFLRLGVLNQSKYLLLGSNAPGGDEDFEASIDPDDFKPLADLLLAADRRHKAMLAVRKAKADKALAVAQAKEEENDDLETGRPA